MKNIKEGIKQYVFEHKIFFAGYTVWAVAGIAMCFVADSLDTDRLCHLAATKELLKTTGLLEKMEKGEL